MFAGSTFADGGGVGRSARAGVDGVHPGTVREGTGVRNTRERLVHLYGEGRQHFDLAADPAGGTVASVLMPFDSDDGPPPTFTAPSAPTSDSVVPVRHEPTPARATGVTPVHATAFRRHTP